MNPKNRPIRSIFTVMSTAIRTLEKEGRLTMEKSYIQHGSTSVYEHSVKVAYTSLYFASSAFASASVLPTKFGI